VIVRIKYIIDVSLTEDFMFATAVSYLEYYVIRLTNYYQNVSIWALIEPAIAICCMSASTWRPLFHSLREKTSVPSGYGAATGNRYFTKNATAAPVSKSNFGISRNHSGYVKSMTDKDDGSYDDSIALRSLALSPGTRRSEEDDSKFFYPQGLR
jgi:hypothetical protein